MLNLISKFFNILLGKLSIWVANYGACVLEGIFW